MNKVHIIGAGLSGLAAALSLCAAGRQVVLYEASPAAGGRCRSYFDRGLGLRIDNGNHLLLSGNRSAMAYLDEIGTRHTLGGPGIAHFPFFDLSKNLRWALAPGSGPIPWWILSRKRRVPGTRLREYRALLRLRRPPSDSVTVHNLLSGAGELYRCLLQPLAVSALNTRTEEALALLLCRVAAESLLLGGRACIPSFPRIGLSESFVDPAVERLRARGASLHLGRRVTSLRIEGEQVVSIATSLGPEAVAAGDAVILAAPPWVATELLPDLVAPNRFETILNVHFAVEANGGAAGFIGLLGGTAEWVFAKHGVVSVTISAANRLADVSAEELAARVWPDVCSALELPPAMPPVRVVKERRATFAATAEQERRRPSTRLRGLSNVALAGDWTATGLPATIEGAIRSGRAAATSLLAA